ncbi:acyl-CoA synthetase [Geothermobacter hydrogeniphilus]|uniref:Acyl-CoA synthetase n=1 Tax=Geothermobacter hydrogeniphilus TaxID=1969733 RepID=A0A2K2H5V8_9BACT|nr:AMP-binding protein [Geothermobacter hydrogeniphilus]PNU18629.1 acyl-CoA synthetase [Geothermobacter hydrogeniphilus]
MNEQAYLDNLRQLWAKNWPAGTPTTPQYPKGEKPLSEYLRAWAQEAPSRPAIHFYGYDLSYAELDKLSNQFANLLRNLGIQPGDGVAVFMPNCPQLHIAYFGIMKCGAIYVPVSPLSKEMELRYQLGDSKPKVVLCFDGLLSIVHPVCKDLGIKHVMATSYSELTPENPTIPLPDLFHAPKVELKEDILDLYRALASVSDEPLDYVPALDDVFALNYTGGTTGLPKGCEHTHRNIIGTAAAFSPVVFGNYSGEASNSIMLNFLPEFWIAGENAGMLFPMFAGNTLVLLARWDAVSFLEAVQYYKVNSCVMLVDSIDEVLNTPTLNDYDLSSIDTTPCISFIKKLNKDYRNRWRKLTGSTIFEAAFGMTETHTCDTFTKGLQDNDFDLSFDPVFVGLPVPGTEFKICDFTTGELKPLGDEGEILIRTATALKGYFNNPKASADLFAEGGWIRTGDLGMVTKEGFIRYMGRRKEMLKVNGMSVFPTEIEAIIGQHPSVASCGVIGRSDEKKGQVPVAFITLKPGYEETEESLRSWCKNAMAVFKVPEIKLMAQMPMTATGKIRKVELEKAL